MCGLVFILVFNFLVYSVLCVFFSSFGIAPIAVKLWLIFKFSLEAKLIRSGPEIRSDR